MAEIPPPNSPAYRDASEKLRRNGGSRKGDPSPDAAIIAVYVCSRDGSYYGSSSMGDLAKAERCSIDGTPTGTRDLCPACGTPRVLRYARLVPIEDQRAAEKSVQRAAHS